MTRIRSTQEVQTLNRFRFDFAFDNQGLPMSGDEADAAQEIAEIVGEDDMNPDVMTFSVAYPFDKLPEFADKTDLSHVDLNEYEQFIEKARKLQSVFGREMGEHEARSYSDLLKNALFQAANRFRDYVEVGEDTANFFRDLLALQRPIDELLFADSAPSGRDIIALQEAVIAKHQETLANPDYPREAKLLSDFMTGKKFYEIYEENIKALEEENA